MIVIWATTNTECPAVIILGVLLKNEPVIAKMGPRKIEITCKKGIPSLKKTRVRSDVTKTCCSLASQQVLGMAKMI